jgi:sec-independent protein translocase protein TatA
MNFSGWEIILVVAVLFLLFGASRLPQLAKSIGQSRKAFKEGLREAEEEAAAEEEQRKLKSVTPAPQLSNLSDEELMAEARRRATLKQQ